MFLLSVCSFFFGGPIFYFIAFTDKNILNISFFKGGFLQNCLYCEINVSDTDWVNRQERIFVFLKKKKLKSSK